MSQSGKRMMSYLPWYYENSRIMQAIQDANGAEVDMLWEALNAILDQVYVERATWGLAIWEKELEITPVTEDIELRRAAVLAKLKIPPTMTPKQLEEVANCFVPGKDAKVIPHNEQYCFDLLLPTFTPWLEQVFDAVDEAKPAHLDYKVEQTLPENRLNMNIGLLECESGVETLCSVCPDEAMLSLNVGIVTSESGVIELAPSYRDTVALLNRLGFVTHETGVITLRMEGSHV